MSKPKYPIIYNSRAIVSFIKTKVHSNYCIYGVLIVLFLFTTNNLQAQNHSNKLKVVLDAGHGGKDPGTSGNGLKEKDIALDVTLLIGALLEKRSDVQVVFTRKTDEFIGLKERADIGNKGKADLFVSLHCNGVASSSPRGFETFVFGIARTKDNLKTAQRENEAIYFEDDYEVTYSNYNPDSPESILTYTLVQEEYLDQSILLAGYIQNNVIKNLKQKNRGVKQDNFLVLRETYMPSVLIELGFLTNKVDATYLNKESSKYAMAKQIVDAIIQYKNNINIIDLKEEVASIKKEQIQKAERDQQEGIVFRVQIAAGANQIDTKPENFKGLNAVFSEYDGNLYRYYYTSSLDYYVAQDNLAKAIQAGYTNAYIVAYDTSLGKKISLSKAINSKQN